MRTTSKLLLALPFVLSFAACSGSNATGGLGAACRGSSSLCLVSCSLGCSLEGCSIKSIPVNQRLVFRFSQPIDPASVSPSTVRLRSSQGEQPIGDLLVQGSDVIFKPAVLSSTEYGFVANEEYSLEIAGGPGATASIESISGDKLGARLACSLVTDLGVVDADGKPPIGELVVPESLSNVKADSLIVVEFSESINTLPFQNGGTGGTILYKVALPDSTAPNGCSRRYFPLPGTAALSEDPLTGRTRVVFRPSLLMPSEACVQVEITDQIRDLSGKSAESQVFDFVVESRSIVDQYIEETFAAAGKADKVRSGAAWGNGKLTVGRLGGSGVLGSFSAVDGKDLQQKDAQGRDIYEWNTDDITISETRTLTGVEIKVTNGVLEFTDFIVGEKEHIRFVGTKPPLIRASGTIQINGVVTLVSPMPVDQSPINPSTGWAGGIGGPGGGAGGQGADLPSYTTGSINGRNGANVQVPTGHPRASQTAGTGGPGALAFPRSGKDLDVVWIKLQNFDIFVRMMANGGSGGSLFDRGNGALLGTTGLVEKTSASPILGPYTPAEFPPQEAASKAFAVLPVSSTVSSKDTFRLGGSGGGGGGTHAAYTAVKTNYVWSVGGGGGGGGGSIAFEAGSDFIVSSTGEIYAQGGGALDIRNSNGQPPARAPGGGGSGGSVLVQAGGVPTIVGKVDVSGGIGGTFAETSQLLDIKSSAGKGGAGYIRVEADPKPSFAAFGGFVPAAADDNTGLLRPIDDSTQSVAASGIYVAQSLFPPTWLYYKIEAKIDGVPVTYSDDPRVVPGSKFADDTQPVAIYFKSVAADAQTSKPIGDFTPWVPATVKDFSLKKYETTAGNGMLYLIVLDKSKTPSKSGTIEITNLRVYYRG
ncbi:MAG: hypothetical protein KDC95_12585 [Planctomycetes bacterium]|nr:hypothetical protein [Planctomycetota bacterium]